MFAKFNGPYSLFPRAIRNCTRAVIRAPRHSALALAVFLVARCLTRLRGTYIRISSDMCERGAPCRHVRVRLALVSSDYATKERTRLARAIMNSRLRALKIAIGAGRVSPARIKIQLSRRIKSRHLRPSIRSHVSFCIRVSCDRPYNKLANYFIFFWMYKMRY